MLKEGSGSHRKISKIFLFQRSNSVIPASDIAIFYLEDEFQNSFSPLVWNNFAATEFDFQETGKDKQINKQKDIRIKISQSK